MFDIQVKFDMCKKRFYLIPNENAYLALSSFCCICQKAAYHSVGFF